MPTKSNTGEFTKKSIEIHGDKFDYSEANYVDARTKITLICKKNKHKFSQMPNDHFNANGCPECPNICTTSEWIAKAKKVHGDKYDYSKADYKGNKIKIIIKCGIHGEFEQRASSHLGKTKAGCPKCAPIRYHTTAEFVDALEKVHGDKYDYSEVNYTGCHEKIIIKCRKSGHGQFVQKAASHMFGHNCPKCVKSYRITKEEWLDIVKERHKNFYNYDKVKYVDATTLVEIKCPEHGLFWQKPRSHVLYGCAKCSNNIMYTTEQFIEMAKKVHNDAYDYSKVDYTGGKNKVTIYCKTHKKFFDQNAKSHLSGTKCPFCKNKTEDKLLSWLANKFSNVEPEARFDWCKNPVTNYHLPFDFYIKDINCIVELDGLQHFKQVYKWTPPAITQRKDVWKMQQANGKNITVIRLLQDDVYKNDDK